jgi:hypothetical protein
MAIGKGKQSGGKGKQGGGNGGKFDDTNRGVLFQNDKDGNDARPDVTGHLFIDPSDYPVDDNGLIKIRLAGWNKSSDRAGDYLSLSASVPKED